MRKDALLKHLKISDPSQVPKLKRIIDLMNQVNKTYELTVSEFFSPDIFKYIDSLGFHYPDLQYIVSGGYHDAEYKRLIIAPDYMMIDEDYITVVDITYHEKYGEIGHRDVLGAVLGLGIKRDFIGDILLETGHVQVMTTKEMGKFLKEQLFKIGRVTVSVQLKSTSEVMALDQETQMINTTVSSLRLDSIIASGYNLSRSKAAEFIKSERVKLNHNFVTQISKEIEEGSLISVRGKGRIVLEQVNGLSKKERYKIVIKKYI